MTQVRIQPSFLLNDRFELPREGLEEVVAEYRKVWEPIAGKIISGLEQITGLTFYPNVIDCYIANVDAKHNISNPLIIGGNFTPEEFVFVLTHELTHLLADDNNEDYNWHEVAKQLWPNKNKFISFHIMTNAIQDALYTDVMNDTDLTIKFIEFCPQMYKGDTHQVGWDMIEERGYQAILQDLKDNQTKTDKKFW